MPLYEVTGDDPDVIAAYDQLGADDSAQPKTAVMKLDANKMFTSFAGSGPISLTASVQTTITIELDMLLRPDWIILPDAAAANVLVVDVKVGAISMNASSGNGAPGDAFKGNSTSRLKALVCGVPAVPVKVVVLNLLTTTIANFSVCLKGPVKRVA